MAIRVADYICSYLERQNVAGVFLLSGGGMMHLVDAVGRSQRLKYVCNHHEQACAMAAEGYARQSGSLGVCFATSGPGGTNTITGIVHAWQDSVPLLVITGQCKVSETIHATGLHGLRQFGTLEVDIVPVVRPITKYAAAVLDPKTIRFHLEKACSLALSGRPGPVLLDIPVDVQGSPIEPSELAGFEEPAPRLEPAIPDIGLALDRLRAAQRPLILAGHGVGVSGARAIFREVIERLGVPVAVTPLAKDLLEYDHPLFVGHPGIKGDRPGNLAVQRADVILSVGCSFHVTTTGYELKSFAPSAFKIQVDPDPLVLRRENVGVQLKINADVRGFLERVRERTWTDSNSQTSRWRRQCAVWKTELSVNREPHKKYPDSINYYEFVDALSDLAPDNATVTADAGSAYYVVGQAFKAKRGQRVLVCGSLGTMGWALPAATGASFAESSRTVICITGDGSLQTNVHELATVRRNQLNVKIFVVNNGGYVSIRNTQKGYFGGRLVGSDETSGVFLPSLEKLSSAYELPYYSARTSADLKTTLAAVLNTRGPVVCEVFAPHDQEIIPTIKSMRLEDGSMRSRPLDEMYPFLSRERMRGLTIEAEQHPAEIGDAAAPTNG